MIYTTALKCSDAIKILKSDAQFVIYGMVDSESDFNKIEWVTGEDENGTGITTTTCPHSEITWTKVKEEMDKL